MAKRIALAIIGYGMSARTFHIPFILENPAFELKKIMLRSRRDTQSLVPQADFTPDMASILNDREIETVIITTPNESHFSLAKQCLNAGKHVVIEKPFTVTGTEASNLIQLAAENKRLLTVFHNRRLDGDFKTIAKLIKSGKLGRLVKYEAHFDRFKSQANPDAWRDSEARGSGILYDLGSHLIDQALVLFGRPSAVTADVRRERETAKADDSFELWLHYDTLKVNLKSSMLVIGQSPKYVLNGTEASFVKYGTDPQEERLKKGEKPGGSGWGEEDESSWGILSSADGKSEKIKTEPGSYQDFYCNLAASIREGRELLVKPEEALETIRIIELSFKSSAQKRSLSFE